ncbi:MAG: CidA/LrgA family protein [Spirochaetia bacterium]
MKILEAFTLFILFFFLGRIANIMIGIPAGLASLFFMFLALLMRIVKLERVESFAQFFLGISGFILLPFFVNGIAFKDLILPVFFSWMLTIFVSTLLTLFCTAWVIQCVQRFILSRKN